MGMKNAKLMVAKFGRTYRAILFGEGVHWPTAMLIVKGQPRDGWSKEDAIRAGRAAFPDQAAVDAYAAGHSGAYVPKATQAKMHMEAIPFVERASPAREAVKALASPAPAPVVHKVIAEIQERAAKIPATVPHAAVPVDEIAHLIELRRQCLRTVAEVDAKLVSLAGPDMTKAIADGMARRLN